MGLAGFSLLFNEPHLSDSKFAIPLTDEDRIREAQDTVGTVIDNTDVIFVDAMYMLLGGTDNAFATGKKFYFNRTGDVAAPPMTMQQLALYVHVLMTQLIATRPKARYVFFGVDNHVHVPVTKHREWGRRSYTAANDNARFYAGGLKSPFSRNEEALAFSIIDFATEHAGDKRGIRDSILGLTFTRSGPLLHALLQDRNTRPIFMSLLFERVFGLLVDDEGARPTLKTSVVDIVLLHPIFNFRCKNAAEDSEVLLPNGMRLIKQLNDTPATVTPFVSTDSFHIGEADLQYAGLLRYVNNPHAQIEVLSDDTDLVIITLLADDGPAVIQWMSDQRVVDLKWLRAKAIPEFMREKVWAEGENEWAVRLFILLTLVVFGNDFYDNPTNIGSTAANFVEAVSLFGKLGLTKDELKALGDNWIFPGADGLTFDMSFMIRVTRAVYYHFVTMKRKGVEAAAALRRVTQILRNKRVFTDYGTRDLADAWTEYIGRPSKFGGYHPVSAIKVDLDGDTDFILKYRDIVSQNAQGSDGFQLKLFVDICTPQQMVAFTHNVVAMFDIDNPDFSAAVAAEKTIQIFETMPPPLEGFPLPVLMPQGFVHREMTEERGLQLKDPKTIYAQLGADGDPSASKATAQVIFREFEHSNAIAKRVFFPGDMSLPSLFARAGMMQWVVCYWMYGFHPSASKQSTIKVREVDALLTQFTQFDIGSFDRVPGDDGRREYKFYMERETQMAPLIMLGGHRLFYEEIAPREFRLRHIVRTCNHELIHGLWSLFNDYPGDTLLVTMVPPRSSISIPEARIKDNLYTTLDATGLYILLEDVVADAQYTPGMDPELLHVRDCLVSLRTTRLDQMVTLSRLDPDWMKKFFALMLSEARSTRPDTDLVPREYLYPDPQIVFVYLYARHFTEVTDLPLHALSWLEDIQRIAWDGGATQAHPVQLLQTMPFITSIVVAGDNRQMLMMQAPTTRVTEVDSAVDVTISSNALGEFSTGFADVEADNTPGNMHYKHMSYESAEIAFDMNDWLHHKASQESEKNEVVTWYNQNLAFQGPEAFISSVQLAIPATTPETDRPRFAALATAELYFEKVANRIVTHDAVTAREFITLTIPRTVDRAPFLEQAKHTAVLIEDEDLMVPCLSGSHDINAYALPLLRYAYSGKGGDTHTIWTRVIIPLLPFFAPYMETSFEFFMLWKMAQSVYLQYISEIAENDDEWTRGFHYVRQFLSLHLPGLDAATWTARLPTDPLSLDTINFGEYRATWPTAMLLSENIHLGQLGDIRAREATVRLLKERVRGNFMILSTFFPSVQNLFIRAVKTEIPITTFSQNAAATTDLTLLFVNWRPYILEHYLLVCLHRAYISLKQIDGAIAENLTFPAFAMRPRFFLAADEADERVVTEFAITIATV